MASNSHKSLWDGVLSKALADNEMSEQDVTNWNLTWQTIIEQNGQIQSSQLDEVFEKFRKAWGKKAGPRGNSIFEKVKQRYFNQKREEERRREQQQQYRNQQILLHHQEQQQQQQLPRPPMSNQMPPRVVYLPALPQQNNRPPLSNNPVPNIPNHLLLQSQALPPSNSFQYPTQPSTVGNFQQPPRMSGGPPLIVNYSNSKSQGMPGSHGMSSIQPPVSGPSTSEVLSQLEKVNTLSEGTDVSSIIYTGSDGRRTTVSTLAAPLLSNMRDFISDESNIAKSSLWDTVTVSDEQPASKEDADIKNRWRRFNITDAAMMLKGLKTILGKEGMKISAGAIAALSNGMQMYARNVMDVALEHQQCRMNESTRKSYGALSRMIASGQGDALPENNRNIALVWSATDPKGLLDQEEKDAKRAVLERSLAEERDLIRELRTADDIYLARRKTHSVLSNFQEGTWWRKEDMAMNAGALTWTELAHVHFKSTVAEMSTLGPYNQGNGPVSRKKSRITPITRMMASDPAITQSRSGNASNSSSTTGSGNLFAKAYSSDVTKDDVVAAIDITAPTTKSKLCTKRSFYLLNNS